MIKNKIKILATVGPNSLHKEVIAKMDNSGVDIFRINLSHTSVEDFVPVLTKLQSYTNKAICVDTEGAQFRTAKIKKGTLTIKPNSSIDLSFRQIDDDGEIIPLYPHLKTQVLKVGDILHIDFNSVIVQITKVNGLDMKARVLLGGNISSNKGIAVDRIISLPFLTQKDHEIIELAKQYEVNHFALSFASSGSDVRKFRQKFESEINIISKIESRLGIMNVEDICLNSNQILIDRGDLSREIPLERISIAQKYILSKSLSLDTPLFVATNLLDTMMESGLPSRAEINDITSSLIEGASGFVLAAETAIGKNPVKTVKLLKRVLDEVVLLKEDFQKCFQEDFGFTNVQPHGQKLMNLVDSLSHHDFETLPQLQVNDRVLFDCIQIAEGAFSPLTGFMGLNELNSVLDHNKLLSGMTWTVPVLLQISEEEAIRLQHCEEALLVAEGSHHIHTKIKIINISRLDNKQQIAARWFLTQDITHPGVNRLYTDGDFIVECDVVLLEKPKTKEESFQLTPAQSRKLFKENFWSSILAFDANDIINYSHEFLQQQAAAITNVDAIFIAPVVDKMTSKDEVLKTIVDSYNKMLYHGFYEGREVLLGGLNDYNRFSGPREIVFRALVKKNYGCSNYLANWLNATGNLYADFDIKAYVESFEDLGIQIHLFDEVVYSFVTKQYEFKNNEKEEVKNINKESLFDRMKSGEELPDYAIRQAVISDIQTV